MHCLKKSLIAAAFCYALFLHLVSCSVIQPLNVNRHTSTIYIVEKGDTLYHISHITGTSVKELAKLNGILPPYIIKTMQKLKTKKKKSIMIKKRISSNKNTFFMKQYKKTIFHFPLTKKNNWVWPAIGKIIVPYSPSLGGNKGIDIAGFRGSPIYAAGTGKVIYVGNKLRGYGNLIIIKHEKNYITAYAHNDTVLVNSGQNVKIGQKIATMGSTGTNFVFLHFQIRYKTIALDPQQYLPSYPNKITKK